MISISNLTKQFGSALALDNISFIIPDNAITAIVGANGAGKTTLLKILVKLLAADCGEIKYDNIFSIKDFRNRIGYLPEQRGLYADIDIETQLLHFAVIRGLTKKEAKNNVSYWLKKFDMTRWSNANITSLSKGMQQKIQLISSLVNMPTMLFMDEPLSGLDPINFRYFCSILKEYQKDFNATIVLSTHNMKSVEQICSNVAILNKSKLKDFGTISDLKRRYATSGTYRIVTKKNKSLEDRVNLPSIFKDFSIKSEDINSEFVELELSSSKNNISLIEAMAFITKAIPNIEIISCSESIPTMEDIFVEINE